jgi:hypothetical protein
MCGLHLENDLFTQLLEIYFDPRRVRVKVQQITYHPLHALSAVQDPRSDSRLTLVVVGQSSQQGGIDYY